MKNKVLYFIIGVLVGAIIATIGYYCFGKNDQKRNLPQERMMEIRQEKNFRERQDDDKKPDKNDRQKNNRSDKIKDNKQGDDKEVSSQEQK